MEKLFNFTPEDRERIRATLVEVADLHDRDEQNEVIDSFERDGMVRDIGFGSLIKNHHQEDDLKRYPATISGYVARFNCAFRFYGASYDFPTVMLGLEESEDGITPGVVTEKSIFKEGEEPSVDGIIDYLKSFKYRENPPGQSVYKLRFMRAQKEDGTSVMGIACYTDPEGPLFVGNGLSLKQKAMLIANEWGSQLNQSYEDGHIISRDEAEDGISARKPHQKTVYSYLVELIDARLKYDFPVEQELWDLLHLTNYYRENMPANKRAFLGAMESGMQDQAEEDVKKEWETRLSSEEKEDLPLLFRQAQQDRRNLDPRVFEAADLSPLEGEAYQAELADARQAIRKVLKMPPLPPEHAKDHEEYDLRADILKGTEEPAWHLEAA